MFLNQSRKQTVDNTVNKQTDEKLNNSPSQIPRLNFMSNNNESIISSITASKRKQRKSCLYGSAGGNAISLLQKNSIYLIFETAIKESRISSQFSDVSNITIVKQINYKLCETGKCLYFFFPIILQ